jgi:GNAT superfamily N-acetyltransferase
MTPQETQFHRYVADRRQCDFPGMPRTELGCAVSFESQSPEREHMLTFTALAPDEADAFIASVIAQADASGRALEWKTYGFDTPPDLIARLQRAGFEPDDAETLMIYPLAKFAARQALAKNSTSANWRVEKVTTARGISHIVSLQETIWGRTFPGLLARLLEDWEGGAQQFYCAYAGDAPIGSGYIEYLAGSAFPELHGGAVLPAYRGQGLYGALFDVRMVDAIRRGFEWIAVDASSMSRPILEKIGFEPVCATRPMRYDPKAA